MKASADIVLTVQCLTEEEMDKPEMVFQQFFEIDYLPGMKESLWQLFEDLTKRQYPHKPGSREYEDTLYLFEKLEKLMEAAYLLK